MLYERWREVAQARGSDVALIDAASGQRLTFRKLFGEGERRPVPPGPAVFPSSSGLSFVLDVLGGWREGNLVCPVEQLQKAALPAGVPPNAIHLKLTSGSTGAPRYVAFTAEQLAADARNIVATMKLTPDSPNLAVISLAHSYGFSNLILPLLLHGIPLILAASPLPENVRSGAALARTVVLPAVPALWKVWLEAGTIPRNIRTAISAGAPLPLSLEETIYTKHGLKIHNFYGSSECGGIAYDRSETPRDSIGAIGQPLDNVQIALDDAGRLIVMGDAVGLGYLPEADPCLSPGKFFTSDLAEIVGGQITLRGRAGDLINVAGRKVMPPPIEEAILASGSVDAVVVFGVPAAEIQGDSIVAAIKPRGELDIPGLRRFLSSRLPNWQIPHEFWLCGDLEPNARGKISRAEWRQRYVEREHR